MTRPGFRTVFRSIQAAMAAAVLAGLAAACSHVPTTSLPALARVDWMATDPDALLAALVLPEGVRPGEARLRLVLALDSGETREEVLRLEPVGGGEPELPGRPDGTTATVYGLPPQEARRLDTFRDAFAEARGTQKGALTISVGASACREPGVATETPVAVSTYLSTTETGRFVPLVRNADLASLGGAQSPPALPPCG